MNTKSLNNSFRVVLLGFLIASLISCSPTKYIPDNSYLLSNINIQFDENKNLNKKDIKPYIKQRPNKRVLGFRFHIRMYSLSNPNKHKGIHNWLRKIGEEPIVYDKNKTRESTQSIKKYLENKGYYFADVSDSVIYKTKNAKVVYSITPNRPYTIGSFAYLIEDSLIQKFVFQDSTKCLINTGQIFDKEKLQEERVRIETMLKNRGYFNFSKEYIVYEAKLKPESYSVAVTQNIKPAYTKTGGYISSGLHQRYRIDSVFIYPDYISPFAMETTDSVFYGFLDTMNFGSTLFYYRSKPSIKPQTLLQFNYILPGEIYRLKNVNKTYRQIINLGVFRLININFETNPQAISDSLGFYPLHAYMELSSRKKQSYQFEIVGTNTEGDMGARGNLSYSNLNLLKGAEVFRLTFTGAIEAVTRYEEAGTLKEFGIQSRLDFPKFLIPFASRSLVKRFNPKTSIQAGYNFQDRPKFTRTIANVSFGYVWKSGKFFAHSLYPAELNYVRVFNIDSTFASGLITNRYSFEDHMISDSRYTLEFSNQDLGTLKDFMFVRFSMESSGNMLNAYSQTAELDTLTIFNVPYFQYVKSDLDVRYYNVINRINSVVFRFYAGVGYPFGNSSVLPFEKKYFAGGPNSVRGWSTRELGPGSFQDTSSIINFSNTMADIKIDLNLEYRFKLFWKLEGALFLDIGNIWDVREIEGREDAFFKWDSFYKQLAVGTGIGTRFDFSFFLIRLDFGMKLRDPIPFNNNHHWIPGNRSYNLRVGEDIAVHFGISYPF